MREGRLLSSIMAGAIMIGCVGVCHATQKPVQSIKAESTTETTEQTMETKGWNCVGDDVVEVNYDDNGIYLLLLDGSTYTISSNGNGNGNYSDGCYNYIVTNIVGTDKFQLLREASDYKYEEALSWEQDMTEYLATFNTEEEVE